jgi:hypothetical protein
VSADRAQELERAYAMLLAALEPPPSEGDYPFGRLQGYADAWIEIQILTEESNAQESREGSGRNEKPLAELLPLASTRLPHLS